MCDSQPSFFDSELATVQPEHTVDHLEDMTLQCWLVRELYKFLKAVFHAPVIEQTDAAIPQTSNNERLEVNQVSNTFRLHGC